MRNRAPPEESRSVKWARNDCARGVRLFESDGGPRDSHLLDGGWAVDVCLGTQAEGYRDLDVVSSCAM
jgi:aminoglycoside-2''-adenylyltransferase